MSFDVKVPAVGESIQEGMVHKWHVKNGDFINKDDVLVELETDKATVDIVAEQSGTVKLLKSEGDNVKVGEVIANINTDAKPTATTKETKPVEAAKPQTTHASPVPQPSPKPIENNQTYHQTLSPAVRKLVVENDIKPETLTGSGKDGRLTKGDVLGALEKPSTFDNSKSTKMPTPSQTPIQKPQISGSRTQRREKMSMIRRTIAKHLVASQQTAAMLTTFNEVDMSAVLDLRQKFKEPFEKKYGIGLGFMGFFLKASVEALMEFPKINAYIADEEIIYNDYIDVGVAVSSERGLLVPVIKNVESMTINQIEQSIADLANRARNNKIGLDELSGGTFTVSNGGVFGSLMSTPILNAPQSAILGMHKIEKRPIVVNDQIVIRPMMYLALSYDHRMVDGKEAVQFLVKIKNCIEDPSRLLIGV